MKNMFLFLSGLAFLLSTGVRAETPACAESRWLVRETDNQLMERVVAISTFPTVLDPRLWADRDLRPEIREKTLGLVDNLFSDLRLGPDVTIGDVELFGSNASYEYDDAADYGVHVFLNNANPAKLDPVLLARLLRIYNLYVEAKQEGKILFNGVVVEVSFHLEPRSGNYMPIPGVGQYSVSEGKWIVEPAAQPDNFDRKVMLADTRHWIGKWNAMVCEYESAASDFDCSRFNALDAELSKYRSAGFKKGLGSRSTENLTYRMLRRLTVNIPDGVDLAEEECMNRKFSVSKSAP